MRVTAALLVTALAATMVGCAARTDPAPGTLIGQSVEEANRAVPPGRSYAWYDLTEQVLHEPATLIGGEDPDGEGGVIIAVCADADTMGASSTISAGAIPRRNYTREIERHAQAGDYRTLLPECATR